MEGLTSDMLNENMKFNYFDCTPIPGYIDILSTTIIIKKKNETKIFIQVVSKHLLSRQYL